MAGKRIDSPFAPAGSGLQQPVSTTRPVRPKTGYTEWGAPVDVDANTPIQRWDPNTGYGQGATFDAPPPPYSERPASSAPLAPAPTQRQAASPTPAPSAPSTAEAYSRFLGTPAVASTRSASVDMSPVTNIIQEMLKQQATDRTANEARQASMRELLQGRIAEASKPVDANAPGIKEQLSAQRLARQRSAERQRSQAATRLSVEGLGDSGAAETVYQGIEQGRGEGESADIAAALGPAQQARRQELLSLYQMAIADGNMDEARQIQQQMAALDASMQVANLQGTQSRFNADQSFRRGSALDNLNLQLLLAGAR